MVTEIKKYSTILMIVILIFLIYNQLNNKRVWDFANIYSAIPNIIYKPNTSKEIKNIIEKYPNHKISIAGSKYSHGGQTLLDNSIYIDLSNFNKIVDFDKNNKLITVESGIIWKKIIRYIDKYDLSVSEMQSYCNFSVGGSISVNCHGRGFLYGTIGDSVENMVVLTSDGQFLFTDRNNYYDLFKSTIGGYGGICIIIYITLRLTNNFPIERKIKIIPSNKINEFYETLKTQQNLVFYNGNIYPGNENEINGTFCLIFVGIKPNQINL